jgi:hypothetical protein
MLSSKISRIGECRHDEDGHGRDVAEQAGEGLRALLTQAPHEGILLINLALEQPPDENARQPVRDDGHEDDEDDLHGLRQEHVPLEAAPVEAHRIRRISVMRH